MKIQNTGSDPYNRLNVENAAAVDPSTKTSGSANSGAVQLRDQAALSDRGRALGKARAALNETPDVRSERVQELKSQIQSGAYQVPYHRLAGRLKSRL